MSRYRIEFITPLFSRGAYEQQPEIRPSSIRGQLHWWFRALGGNHHDEKEIFGGIHKGAKASKLVIRVSNVSAHQEEYDRLPHKSGGRAAPLAAFAPGSQFDLHVLTRLKALPDKLQAALDRTVHTWLLLGSLGLRATRAGGSFRWLDGNDKPHYPRSFAEYESTCRGLLKGSRQRFALLPETYDDSEAARLVVSDTLGGPDRRDDSSELSRLNWPLGDVSSRKDQRQDRSRRDRKASPLRFRLVAAENTHRIAAIWDGRSDVTGNNNAHLTGIIQLLAEKKPALGRQLAASTLAD